MPVEYYFAKVAMLVEHDVSMELRTLTYFVAVVEAGSVSAASRDLHVSQPSLSRQVHQLGRELGLDLFVQREGRLVPSAAGLQFLDAAREVLDRAANARAMAEQIRSGAMSSVTLAAPEVTSNDVLAPFFATWTADDPMPRVIRQDPADEYGALNRGADIVIGTRPPPRALAHALVAELAVHAYVRAAHPLAGRERIPLSELVRHPLLVPPRTNHARRALDSALEALSLGPGTWTEVASSQMAQANAAAGRGVAVVSDDERFGLLPVAIDGPSGQLSIRLHAAWTTGHHAHQQLSALVKRLQGFVAGRYEGGLVAP